MAKSELTRSRRVSWGIRSWLVVAIALVGQLMISPVRADSTRFLNASYYTNGRMKTVTTESTFNACGKYSDIRLTVYYDFLNKSRMNIRKVVVEYYLKGSGAINGGSMMVTSAQNSQSYLPNWDTFGDFGKTYPFKKSTKDREGYSFVGSYTHNGPKNVVGRSVSFTKWWAISRCGSWGDSPGVMGFTW